MSLVLGYAEGMNALLVSASAIFESRLQSDNSNEPCLHGGWSLVDNISKHCQLMHGRGRT